MVLLCVWLSSFNCGCDSSSTVANFSQALPTSISGNNVPAFAVQSELAIKSEDKPLVFELGVLPVDQTRQLIVPFSRIAIGNDWDVSAFRSSCDCVCVEEIQVFTNAVESERCVLITAVPVEDELASEMKLLVEVFAEVAGRKLKVFRVSVRLVPAIGARKI